MKALPSGVIFAHVLGLLQGHHAGDRTGVGKVVVVVVLARALDEDHRLGGLAVGRAHDLAGLGDRFELVVGDHIGQLTVTQVGVIAALEFVRPPAGSQDHGTEQFAVRVELQDVVPCLCCKPGKPHAAFRHPVPCRFHPPSSRRAAERGRRRESSRRVF
jgi:hypothetical protein